MADTYTEVVAEEIVKVTDKAILADFEDVGEVWIPKSCIKDADDLNEGDRGKIIEMEEWLAQKENLA